ncbi:helix-turn-helix domain-containing protein [Thauera humireducens]|uniref:Helix-turn-helix domain-containing protein n=1 Tax=Thauera humireducens TaxID=1134435 RepID=A0A127K3W8_9RHOO|nr:helix-turn-helix domain-containing protein [Thauera humireducens]AMO36652.1 hypothetical protein AC731_006680 [Thauera humireducens]
MTIAIEQHAAMLQPVTLSAHTENRLLFWSSPEDALFPADVAAHVLDVDYSTLARWRCTEQGPKFCKRGNKIYYRKRDLVDWMQSKPQAGASPQ